MKAATKQDFKIAALAWLTVAAMFGFMGIMYWAGIDWEKWLGFTFLTATVFGVVLYGYAESLKKTRCLLLFVTILVAHFASWGYYLRSISGFPAKLFFVAPFEGAAVVGVLVGVGGAPVFRYRAHDRRRHEADRDVKPP